MYIVMFDRRNISPNFPYELIKALVFLNGKAIARNFNNMLFA